MSLTYGSGQVVGTIAQDTVSMSGFTVSNQVFGSFSLSHVSEFPVHVPDSRSR